MIGRALGAAASVLAGTWARATRRPVDAFAILSAAAVTVVIVVNALFLQSGAHPAPFFTNPTRRLATNEAPARPMQSAALPQPADPPAHTALVPVPVPRTAQPVSIRHSDPIADLIGPSPRIAAVQRVLSDYGYGQIKPSGMLDEATGAAIEKFERDHKIPVTGKVSNRLLTELGTLAGHPIE
jgi:hypothetical protein